MIDRFQFLFLLPARVRQNISLNEKGLPIIITLASTTTTTTTDRERVIEKVLRDYEKARRLVRSSNIVLFKKIFVEIHAQIIAFAQLLYADLRRADLNRQSDALERLIKLIDEFNAIIVASSHNNDELTQSESNTQLELPRDIGRPPAVCYARRRFAWLRRRIERAPLPALRDLVLTREIEFLEQYFPLDALLKAFAATHNIDDELAEPPPSTSTTTTTSGATSMSARSRTRSRSRRATLAATACDATRRRRRRGR
jgi:hypothetical protein